FMSSLCDVYFFFSSRRRHTRWPRDWSSDVCSSDLMYGAPGIGLAATQVDVHQRLIVIDISPERNQPLTIINPQILAREGEASTRSEERRVGKECRSRWSAEH